MTPFKELLCFLFLHILNILQCVQNEPKAELVGVTTLILILVLSKVSFTCTLYSDGINCHVLLPISELAKFNNISIFYLYLLLIYIFGIHNLKENTRLYSIVFLISTFYKYQYLTFMFYNNKLIFVDVSNSIQISSIQKTSTIASK